MGQAEADTELTLSASPATAVGPLAYKLALGLAYKNQIYSSLWKANVHSGYQYRVYCAIVLFLCQRSISERVT